MAQRKRPTINDVARLAGLSKKTVSRVMNNEGFVRDETRRKVRQVATEIGYQPDRRARALAARRSFVIGLAFDNANASYTLNLLQGALAVANPRGYEIIAHPAGDGATATDASNFIARAGIDGVILSPPMSELREVVTALETWACPVVRIAGDDATIAAHQVRFDDRSAAVDVTVHLLRLGHRIIGFVGGPRDQGPTRRRLAGHLDALASKSGLGLAPDHIAWGDFTFSSGVKCGHQLLQLAQRPSAIFCCNDEMAAGVIHAAQELGLNVPEDVSVTGFDDAPIALQVWPTLTTVKQPVREMGATAAQRLIELIEAPGTEPGIDELRHSLILRESTASPSP